MYSKLIIEGNAVYEIDEECVKLRRRGRRGFAEREERPRPGALDGTEAGEGDSGK